MALTATIAPDGTSRMTIEPITAGAGRAGAGAGSSIQAVNLTSSPSQPLKKVLCKLFPKTEYMKRPKEVSLFLIALNQASALEHFNLEAIKTKLQKKYSGKELEQRSTNLLNKRVNCVGTKHLRPLHVAAMVPNFNGRPSAELVQHLLDNGADIKALADGAWTAMHFAACRADDETLEVLRRHCEKKGILSFFERTPDFCGGTWKDLYRLVTPETDTTVNFMDKEGTLTVHDTLSAAKKVGARTFVTQSSVCTGDRLVQAWINKSQKTSYRHITSDLKVFYEKQARGKAPKLAITETDIGYGLTLVEGKVKAGNILCIYEGEFFPDKESASIADMDSERVKNGTVNPSVNIDTLNEATDYNLDLISGLEVRSPAMYVNDGFPNVFFATISPHGGQESVTVVRALVDLNPGTICLENYGTEHSVKHATPHIELNQTGLDAFITEITRSRTSIVNQYKALRKKDINELSMTEMAKLFRLGYIFSTRPAILQMILKGYITAEDAIKCLDLKTSSLSAGIILKRNLKMLIKLLNFIIQHPISDSEETKILETLKSTNQADCYLFLMKYTLGLPDGPDFLNRPPE